MKSVYFLTVLVALSSLCYGEETMNVIREPGVIKVGMDITANIKLLTDETNDKYFEPKVKSNEIHKPSSNRSNFRIECPQTGGLKITVFCLRKDQFINFFGFMWEILQKTNARQFEVAFYEDEKVFELEGHVSEYRPILIQASMSATFASF